jgi:hypothetical protein
VWTRTQDKSVEMYSMVKHSQPTELLYLVQLAYGPADPALGSDRYIVLEQQLKHHLWQLDEGHMDHSDCSGPRTRMRRQSGSESSNC